MLLSVKTSFFLIKKAVNLLCLEDECECLPPSTPFSSAPNVESVMDVTIEIALDTLMSSHVKAMKSHMSQC